MYENLNARGQFLNEEIFDGDSVAGGRIGGSGADGVVDSDKCVGGGVEVEGATVAGAKGGGADGEGGASESTVGGVSPSVVAGCLVNASEPEGRVKLSSRLSNPLSVSLIRNTQRTGRATRRQSPLLQAISHLSTRRSQHRK